MSKTPKNPGATNGAAPHVSAADLDAAINEAKAQDQSQAQADATGEPAAQAEPEVVMAPKAGAQGADAAGETQSLREQLQRMGADFENFRKRSRQAEDEQRRYNIQRVLNDMLPVIDNLERALMHAPDNNKDPVIEGVRMVAKQWHDVLGNYGVKTFKSQGERFDPERHEAVGQQTSPTNAPGTVLTEHVSGYMIHERLLRPARVVVADQASGAELT